MPAKRKAAEPDAAASVPDAAAAPAAAPAKRSKKAAAAKPAPAAADATADAAADAGDADVFIVSSKACQAFASRAKGLVAAIAKASPQTKVVVDERKAEARGPDRGSFVVSVRGTTVVECRSMLRPFKAMKALDMADVATRVIAAL